MLYVCVDHFLSNVKLLKWYLTLNQYIAKLTFFLIVSTQCYHFCYWHVKVIRYNFDSSKGYSIQLRRHWCWGSRVIKIHSSKSHSWQHLSKYIHVKSTVQAHAQGCCANNKRQSSRQVRQQQEKIFLVIKEHFLLLLSDVCRKLSLAISTTVLCMCFFCQWINMCIFSKYCQLGFVRRMYLYDSGSLTKISL